MSRIRRIPLSRKQVLHRHIYFFPQSIAGRRASPILWRIIQDPDACIHRRYTPRNRVVLCGRHVISKRQARACFRDQLPVPLPQAVSPSVFGFLGLLDLSRKSLLLRTGSIHLPASFVGPIELAATAQVCSKADPLIQGCPRASPVFLKREEDLVGPLRPQ